MLKRIGFTLVLIPLFYSGILKSQIQCDNDSTGLIPIQDLGAGYYLDTWQGGMYPGGSNVPPATHLARGIQIVKKLKPLDTLGAVNYEEGYIVLAGFGSSMVGGPINHAITAMNYYSDLNPCLKIVNAVNPADDLPAMTIGNDEYWDYIVTDKLTPKGIKPVQVQVGWFMLASQIDSNGTDIESYVDTLMKRFTVALNAMIYYYPNLKVVFISGFPYGGYADSLKLLYHIIHEPVSYHHNFAVKELISSQISGNPLLRFKDPGKMAPYIVWGPPIWADGVKPTEYDSLTWDCETEFIPTGGGYHLNDQGKDKLAILLLDFFRTDTLSESWVLDGPKWGACPGTGKMTGGTNDEMPVDDGVLSIYPNPSSGEFYADIDEVISGAIDVKIFDHLGELVFADHYESNDGYSAYRFDLNGRPPGIYYFSILIDDRVFTKPFILNR